MEFFNSFEPSTNNEIIKGTRICGNGFNGNTLTLSEKNVLTNDSSGFYKLNKNKNLENELHKDKDKLVVLSEGRYMKLKMASNEVYDAEGFLAFYSFVALKGIFSISAVVLNFNFTSSFSIIEYISLYQCFIFASFSSFKMLFQFLVQHFQFVVDWKSSSYAFCEIQKFFSNYMFGEGLLESTTFFIVFEIL